MRNWALCIFVAWVGSVGAAETTWTAVVPGSGKAQQQGGQAVHAGKLPSEARKAAPAQPFTGASAGVPTYYNKKGQRIVFRDGQGREITREQMLAGVNRQRSAEVQRLRVENERLRAQQSMQQPMVQPTKRGQ